MPARSYFTLTLQFKPHKCFHYHLLRARDVACKTVIAHKTLIKILMDCNNNLLHTKTTISKPHGPNGGENKNK